jgi:hypothetical protein
MVRFCRSRCVLTSALSGSPDPNLLGSGALCWAVLALGALAVGRLAVELHELGVIDVGPERFLDGF